MKVTVYTFVKNGESYQCVNGLNIYTVSENVFACMDRQYRMMGYAVKDEGIVISYTKVEITMLKK